MMFSYCAVTCKVSHFTELYNLISCDDPELPRQALYVRSAEFGDRTVKSRLDDIIWTPINCLFLRHSGSPGDEPKKDGV